MVVREFNKLEEMKRYYHKDTNTYVFKEGGSYIDLVVFKFSLNVQANIESCDIDACDIKAHNIIAGEIRAYNIDANDISAGDINAHNINAIGDINSWDIKACNINANNLDWFGGRPIFDYDFSLYLNNELVNNLVIPNTVKKLHLNSRSHIISSVWISKLTNN